MSCLANFFSPSDGACHRVYEVHTQGFQTKSVNKFRSQILLRANAKRRKQILCLFYLIKLLLHPPKIVFTHRPTYAPPILIFFQNYTFSTVMCPFSKSEKSTTVCMYITLPQCRLKSRVLQNGEDLKFMIIFTFVVKPRERVCYDV